MSDYATRLTAVNDDFYRRAKALLWALGDTHPLVKEYKDKLREFEKEWKARYDKLP